MKARMIIKTIFSIINSTDPAKTKTSLLGESVLLKNPNKKVLTDVDKFSLTKSSNIWENASAHTLLLEVLSNVRW